MRGARAVLLAAAVLASVAALQATGLEEAEATTPSIARINNQYVAALDLSNDGTWAAKLTINFNTPMAVHTSEQDALGEILVKQGFSGRPSTAAQGSAIEFSGNSVIIRYLPAAEETLRVMRQTGTTLWISGTALKSADTGTALGGFGQRGIIGSGVTVNFSGQLVQWTNDDSATPPNVVSAGLDRDGRIVAIVTDESLAYGWYDGSPSFTYPSTLNAPGQTDHANATKFHLRDGATASTGGVTMSASNNPSTHRYPVHEIRFELTQTQLDTVAGYASPYLHIDAEAFSGMTSDYRPKPTPPPTPNTAIAHAINYLPGLSAAELAVSSRTLSLAFNEAVTRDKGAFYIRDGATGDYDETTDAWGTLGVSGTSGTATLTLSGMTRVLAMSAPHLHLEDQAVKDADGGPNIKKTRTLALDPPGPVLTGSAIDTATGAATLAFDRPVAAGTGDIDVRDGAGAAHDAARDVRISASGVSASGYSATFALSPADLAKVNAMASPHVYLAPSVVTGANGNANAALAAGQDAVLTPELVSASLAPGTRELSATFSERVAEPLSGPGSVYVAPAGDANGFTSGADVRLALSDTSVSHAAEITSAELGRVLAMTSPRLYAEANAAAASVLAGAPGLANAAASVPLSISPPAISTAGVDLGTGAVTITFTYAVSAGSGNVDLVDGQAAAYDPSTHVRVAVSDTTVSGNQMTFTLSEADRQKAISMGDSLRARLPAGAVSGGTGLDNAAVTHPFDTRTPDGVHPEIVSASIDEGTGVLTLTFNETVKAGDADVDQSKIFINDGAFTSGGTPLEAGTPAAGAAVTSTGNAVAVTAKLTEAQRQTFIGWADPHVRFALGAVKDLAERNILQSTSSTGINDDTTDDDPPKVASASLDEGTGILTITFDETVDVSSASGNGASFKIREAGAAAGSQGEVTLSDGEIAASQSDGTTFVFNLSEASRQGAIALSDPYLHIAAGAIADVISPTANAIAADADGTQIDDTDDATAPTILSAEATALNKITVTFSEKAKTANTGGEGWSVSGTDAGTLHVNQNSDISSGATEVVLTLSGNLPGTNPDIALRYEISGTDVGSDAGSGDGAVADTSDNALAARSNIAVSDGIKPEIESAKVTGPRQITIVYSETVTHNLSHYNNINVGGARFASGFAGANTGTAVLSFAGANTGTDATGTVQINYGAIRDGSGNALGSGNVTQNLTDGQAPTFTAKATALDKITVTFSESMNILDTTAQGWSVSGTDATGRTVDSSTAVSNGNTVVLTLDSDLEDTKPDGVVLRYKTSSGDVTGDANSGSGAIADPASNALVATQSTAVSDGIGPEIESAKVTGPGQLTITYSEAVTASQSHYGSASVGGQTATISSISGQTTATHVISFTAPNPVGTGATGSVQINAAQVKDGSDNALGTETALSQDLADGQAPAITSAKATSPTTIEVTFSESLASGAGEQGWSVSGADAAGRSVASGAGSGDRLVLTLDSGLEDTRPDGVLLRYKTSAGDVNSDPGSGSGAIRDGASNALAARSNIAVSDGIAPTVSSAKYTSRNAVELEFSEPVRFASGSAPTGWAATGADAVASPTSASSITTLTTSSATSAAVLTLGADLADKTLLDFTLSYSNGNIEDESDNALAPYSEKPDDGIAPVVLSAQSRALNEITVIFSEAVTATGTAGAGGWAISGADSNSRLVSSRSDISSAASNTLTLRLDGNLNEPIGTVALAYDGSGDAKDRSDNALAAQSVSVSQNLPPTISSAKITGPNRATITYSEPVTASAGAYSGLTVGTARSITSYTQTSAAAHVLVFGGPAAGTGAAGTLTIDQSQISDGVLNLGTSQQSQPLTDGQVPTFSAGVTDSRTVLVAFSEQVSSSDNAASHWTLSGADARAVSSVSALSNSGTMAITVGADFAANVADLKISYSAAGTVSDSAGNVLASVSAAAVSDEQRPSIASAVAGTDNSITVTLTRNSAGSATDAGTTWTLSGTDATGLSVSGYPGISSDTVILALSGNLPDTAPDLSISYNASVGNIADSAGKQMRDQTVPVSDGLKPRIDGAALNEGTGVLTVTFTEQVTVTSGLHLRESGSAGGIQLPPASGTVLSFTLSEAQRQQAVAFETPSLRMDAGAAADSAGLSSDAADVRVSATADAVPPVAGSAFLDLGTGILAISFDENLGSASNPSLLSISGSLTGAQVSVSGSTATVSLTEQQRQAAIGQTSPSLVLGAGAFRDVSGTGSAPATLPLRTVPDDDRPGLVTAALNTDTSVLVLEFDETMDASAFSAQLPHVRITGSAQEITVSGTVSLDGVKVRVQVDRDTLNAVLDSISSSLRIETRGAQFEDTSGNAAPQADVELAIGDDSPPRLVSASVISPDTVLAIFHEDLDGSSVQPSDFDVGGLVPVSASEERGTVTLKLDAEYDERSAPTVSLTGPVSDLFGNAQSSGSVQSVNNIVRVAVSEFTVSASGGLAVAGEQISISFRATEQVQNPALSINGDSVPVTPAENGFTASYAVPPGSPQGPLSVSLSVESRTGTPASFTERDLTGPNVSVDTVPPEILSASASGTDSVTVRYSEPVLADASGASVEVSSVTYPVSVSGSGSETVLVYWDGAGSVPPSAILRGLDVRDIAGNPGPAGPVNAGASSDAASPGPTGVLPIAKGTTLRTVEVPASTEPALELSSASATDPRVLSAGGRTAELENPLSVITREPGLPDLFFQAGTEVGGLAGLTVAGADLEAVILVSPSDYEVPAGSPALDAYPELRNPATAVLVGSPVSDIAFSKPVRIEFDVPLSGLVFTVNAAGDVLPIPACAEGYGGAVPLLQEAPDLWPPETYDPLACVSGDSVWTLHFSVFGVAYPSSGGSECDDCTPPTLGYDAYGARLVDGGFAYNGLVSDVEYFFTPYPLIESEVGEQNTISLKIYENEGPQNVQRVSIAFGLRSGEVISESKAVINYDIFADGTGALSVIDPDNAIGDSPSASHEVVECAAGSALECLSVTVSHSFRAPLEFDIVGTDVWDSQRNSWQNYFNHGLRITGESMNPVPGVAVNGGSLVLHPIAEGSNNVEVMAGEDGALYRLSPGGTYEPLRNISSLFHSIDESMYTYRGTPMQGYDRSDPEFAGMLEEQIQLAKAVLERMNLGRQGWHEGFEESEQSVHAAIDRMERLQESLLSERERAERIFLDRYGPTDRPE